MKSSNVPVDEILTESVIEMLGTYGNIISFSGISSIFLNDIMDLFSVGEKNTLVGPVKLYRLRGGDIDGVYEPYGQIERDDLVSCVRSILTKFRRNRNRVAPYFEANIRDAVREKLETMLLEMIDISFPMLDRDQCNDISAKYFDKHGLKFPISQHSLDSIAKKVIEKHSSPACTKAYNSVPASSNTKKAGTGSKPHDSYHKNDADNSAAKVAEIPARWFYEALEPAGLDEQHIKKIMQQYNSGNYRQDKRRLNSFAVRYLTSIPVSERDLMTWDELIKDPRFSQRSKQDITDVLDNIPHTRIGRVRIYKVDDLSTLDDILCDASDNGTSSVDDIYSWAGKLLAPFGILGKSLDYFCKEYEEQYDVPDEDNLSDLLVELFSYIPADDRDFFTREELMSGPKLSGMSDKEKEKFLDNVPYIKIGRRHFYDLENIDHSLGS